MTRRLVPVLLLAVLAGCATPPPIPDGPLTAQGPVPAGATPAATIASATPETRPVVASSATPARTTAPPAPACRAADLVAEEGHHPGRPIHPSFVAGTVYDWTTDVQLRNRAAQTCTLRGWVRLPAVIGSNLIKGCLAGDPDPSCGRPIDTTTRHPLSVRDLPGATTTNVLPPGGRAQFSILWISSGLMLPGTCAGRRTDPPYRLEIQVPGDATPLVLDLPSINPCDYEVGVLPVGAFG